MLRLLQDTAALLHKTDPAFPRLKFSGKDFAIRNDCLGPGYACFTEKAMSAARLLEETTGIPTNGTYTAKTFSAILADAAAGALDNKVVLFWNMFNSRDLTAVAESVDYRQLPHASHHHFEEDIQPQIFYTLIEDRWIVGVEAEDKARLHEDAVVVQHVDDFGIGFSNILNLTRRRKRLGPDRFEPHQQIPAPTLRRQVDKLRIINDVEGCATEPPLPQLRELCEKCLGVLAISYKVRIEKENNFALQRSGDKHGAISRMSNPRRLNPRRIRRGDHPASIQSKTDGNPDAAGKQLDT